MINLDNAIAFALTTTALMVLAASGQSLPYRVQWVGAQRDVMRGDLSSHIALESLAGRPHLYALGPLEQLRGEITIWDGQPSIARIRSGQIVIDRTFSHRAAFLVWAEVERWRPVPMPAITDVAELEKFILSAARNTQIDTSQPFPFVIRGQTPQITFHVLDKRDGLPHTPELHERAKVRFMLERTPVEIVGFFSDRHQGIFIPHDRMVHMHVRTPDERMSGHVDEIRIAGDALLHLPRVRTDPKP